MEVVDNDSGFLMDCFRLSFHPRTKFLLGLLLVKLRVVFHRLYYFIETGVCGVVFQHIHDEAFFDGLFHSVLMEWRVLNLAVRLCMWRTKHFQRLCLWGCCKGIVVGILHHLASFYDGIEFVLQILAVGCNIARQSHIHLGGQRAILATVCLVYDDAKPLVLQICPYCLQYVLELMDDSDDYLLSVL